MFTVTTDRGAYPFTNVGDALAFLEALTCYGELCDESGRAFACINSHLSRAPHSLCSTPPVNATCEGARGARGL